MAKKRTHEEAFDKTDSSNKNIIKIELLNDSEMGFAKDFEHFADFFLKSYISSPNFENWHNFVVFMINNIKPEDNAEHPLNEQLYRLLSLIYENNLTKEIVFLLEQSLEVKNFHLAKFIVGQSFKLIETIETPNIIECNIIFTKKIYDLIFTKYRNINEITDIEKEERQALEDILKITEINFSINRWLPSIFDENETDIVIVAAGIFDYLTEGNKYNIIGQAATDMLERIKKRFFRDDLNYTFEQICFFSIINDKTYIRKILESRPNLFLEVKSTAHSYNILEYAIIGQVESIINFLSTTTIIFYLENCNNLSLVDLSPEYIEKMTKILAKSATFRGRSTNFLKLDFLLLGAGTEKEIITTIEKFVSPYSPDEIILLSKSLHFGIRKNFEELIKFLLKNDENLVGEMLSFSEKDTGQTALHIASVKNYFPIFDVIFSAVHAYFESKKIRISSIKDNEQNTALYSALEKGSDIKIIYKLCLVTYFNYGDQNKQGNNFMHLACMGHNNPRIIVELLQKNNILAIRNAIQQKNLLGEGVLHIAAKFGNLDLFKCLIEFMKKYNINEINSSNNDNETALHIACKYNQKEIVSELLSDECNLFEKNINGDQAIYTACVNGNLKIFKLIFCKSPEKLINIKNKNGESLLSIALRNKHDNILFFLLDQPGYDFTYQDEKGENILHIACKCKNLKFVQNIFEKLKKEEKTLILQIMKQQRNNQGQNIQDLAKQDAKILEFITNEEKHLGQMVNITAETTTNIPSSSTYFFNNLNNNRGRQ